jgi:integrase
VPRQAFQCHYNERTGLYRKRLKGINGKYVDLYDKDKAALEVKYKKASQDVEANLHIGADITVAEYAFKWFHLNTAELSPSRKSDHQISINNHILPVLGNMKIQDVQPDDAKKILLNMKNLSHSMQSKAVTTLKQIFSAAEENRLIRRSPCSALKAGGYASRGKEPLSNEQTQTLIEAVKNTSVYPFVMLGLYAGLRREEILGLQWDCIHFGEVPYLSVRRALTFDKCKPILSDTLKTPAAKRNIPMPPQLVDCLQSLDRQSEFVAWKKPSYSAFRNMWKLVERRKVKKNR